VLTYGSKALTVYKRDESRIRIAEVASMGRAAGYSRFVLSYGSEALTVCKRNESRIRTAEVASIRRTKGYTRLNYEKNLDIIMKLNTQPVMEFIDNYRSNREMSCSSSAPIKNPITNSP
jgi:hypothetical protein